MSWWSVTGLVLKVVGSELTGPPGLVETSLDEGELVLGSYVPERVFLTWWGGWWY